MNKPNTQVASCETTHTATPWATDGRWIVQEINGRSFWPDQPFICCMVSQDIVGVGKQEANAHFIVKAVNCHADLLSALKKCEDVLGMARLEGKLSDSGLSPVNDAIVAARQAIDKTR